MRSTLGAVASFSSLPHPNKASAGGLTKGIKSAQITQSETTLKNFICVFRKKRNIKGKYGKKGQVYFPLISLYRQRKTIDTSALRISSVRSVFETFSAVSDGRFALAINTVVEGCPAWSAKLVDYTVHACSSNPLGNTEKTRDLHSAAWNHSHNWGPYIAYVSYIFQRSPTKWDTNHPYNESPLPPKPA